ncbi:flagellar biosynthesis protein FlhA [Buchnera aphidicola str. Bp (Baizongia pistaciae)]|uniref:Flagellar biosynthesis protein FlhA n=1 Tax=Buchnera aphidicola subsp. Baizongia pistaciae (strain Bp) TaxID=224915 RepID=FLHA_BUCBP|nr:flagellar biosynthesis protein FlhA [Buchnera aphidicola]Q89AN5.1 RecName: Full=Flagellar biosynthesis protein FlhA [Buchnera aphidicola str. Bp (Baizongia pistaciae)]AAO26954.1 flagellar biosynthesis protein FlhA [Buchnera aphidicola str. Bp (Baizongia pistaciae)]
MANILSIFKTFEIKRLVKFQTLSGPVLILIILSMMVLPLAPFILDLFFTFNIALSIVVLLMSMFTTKTLEFTSFPTILLFSTLLRLALNIASTRIILLNGHIGSCSAGNVIQAFGHFLVGGNFTIGIIVFIILIIINFMVITKGASRIAEVGARFTLDGMPGKQMAIDADLNAGLIGEKQAKKRRIEINQEADFYGSMDGASKFVRGDAIAGILIMIVNIIGGLVIGILQHNMTFSQAAQVYTILTIGDGLVAQIPALVVSTASGVIVTRVSTDQNVSEQIVSQLFCNPQVILLSGIVLGVLGLVPGMPNIIFLIFTTLLFFISWLIYRNPVIFTNFESTMKKIDNTNFCNISDASWNDVQLEGSISIELGNLLIPMIKVNSKKSNLLDKIRNVRKKCAKNIGFLPPLVHIRDNNNLPGNCYCILIKGIEISKGTVQCGKFLAINSGNASGPLPLPAEETSDPIFKFKSFWITSELINQAKQKGYNIAEDSTVISTHLNHIILTHISLLFGRQEAQQLLDYVSKFCPKLIEDLIPNSINLTIFHQVLQNLLIENVPIRDMQTILETLITHAPNYQNDSQILTSLVRISLGKLIIQNIFQNNKIEVIKFDSKLEQILLKTIANKDSVLEPGLYNYIVVKLQQEYNNCKLKNIPCVLLVHHNLRVFIAKMLLKNIPKIFVLSNLELEDVTKIYTTNIIGDQTKT